MKLNGVHQLLVHADDVYVLGGSVRSMKTSTDGSVGAGEENGLEVNVDKTNYVIMSRDQNAGRIHSIKIDNGSSESVEQLKYFLNNFNVSKLYSGGN